MTATETITDWSDPPVAVPNGTWTTFEWIPANQFVTDPAYDRPLSTVKVRRIVNDFNPDAVGVVYASRRADNTNVLMDGQHRTAAFLAMDWAEQRIPTLVFHGLTAEAEAALFVEFNAKRTKPTQYDLFRARLAAGDPVTMEVTKILHRHGLELVATKGRAAQEGTSTHLVSAVGACERVYENGSAKALDEALTVLKAAWGDTYGSKAYSAALISGVGVLLSRYSPKAVNRKRLIERLQTTTPMAVQANARVLAQHTGSGSTGFGQAGYVARETLALYNHKLHNKVVWQDDAKSRKFWSPVQ